MTTKLTAEEKKQKRKEYMKNYYANMAVKTVEELLEIEQGLN